MIIVKIGGGAQINIEGTVQDLASIEEQAIIVHGANAMRDRIAEKLGKPKRVLTSLSGYTSVYSDDDAIDVLLMAYAGLKNKRIVECCQKHGLNAIGLSGLDGRIVQGRRNRGIRVMENEKKVLRRDFSGKPESVNEELLRFLLDNGYVPVLSVPIADEHGHAINSENDDIVRTLHAAVRADRIVHLIEAPGLLDDAEDETTLIREIRKEDLAAREEQVHGRMKRKMLALRKLFEESPTEVILADGRSEHPLRDALSGKGTVIR